MSHTPFIFGLAAFSGAGKTTLAEKLISHAAAKGLVISSIKHAHHKFEPDVVGKDSWRHRQAGARQTLIASADRSALYTENPVSHRPQLSDLLAQLGPCDWVLVEGFKTDPIVKCEVFDPALGNEPLYPTDPHITAFICDERDDNCALPQYRRDDVAGIFAHLQALSEGRSK